MLRRICLNHKTPAPFWKKCAVYIAIILLAIILGYASEWLEYAVYSNLTYNHNALLVGLSMVFDNFSIWIFIATLIAYFSWSPISAGLQTFSFFVAMCTAYFIPKHEHYGYAVDLQLIFWCVIAFLSIPAAILIWLSRTDTPWGILIRSLPTAAILSEFGYTVHWCIQYYSPIPGGIHEPLKWLLQPERLIQLGFYLLIAAILPFVLSRGAKQKARISFLSLGIGSALTLCIILIF